MLTRFSVSELVPELAWCAGGVLVLLACLMTGRTSLRTRGGVLRTIGNATLLAFGVVLVYTGIIISNDRTMVVAGSPWLPFLALFAAVAGVGTALVVVRQQQASTLRWPLAALCMGSALTSIYYLGNAISGIAAVSTPFSISLMLCATTSLGWAMLGTAFPRMYLQPVEVFIRCVLAALLLCGGTIGLHTLSANMSFYAVGLGIEETVGAVGMLTLIISALTLLAMILDRRVVLQRVDLVASQQLYQALYDENPDAVFTLDLDGRVLSANTASASILGQRVDLLLSQPFEALLHPDERKRWCSLFASVVDSAMRRVDIKMSLTQSQTVEVTLIPLLIEELVVGVYGIAKDKTTQREAVAALESMEARYRSAFEYAPTAMALVAPTGRYVAVNRALSQLLGYSEQELLAMSWLDLTPPEAYEAELAVVQKMLAGELRTHRGPLRYRHKQGHSVWTERHLVLARDGGYEPLYFICEVVERLPPPEQPWRHIPGKSRLDHHRQGHQIVERQHNPAMTYTVADVVRAELDGIFNALHSMAGAIALERSSTDNASYRSAREYFWARV